MVKHEMYAPVHLVKTISPDHFIVGEREREEDSTTQEESRQMVKITNHSTFPK